MVGEAPDKENRLQKTPRLLLKRVASDRGERQEQKEKKNLTWKVRFCAEDWSYFEISNFCSQNFIVA